MKASHSTAQNRPVATPAITKPRRRSALMPLDLSQAPNSAPKEGRKSGTPQKPASGAVGTSVRRGRGAPEAKTEPRSGSETHVAATAPVRGPAPGTTHLHLARAAPRQHFRSAPQRYFRGHFRPRFPPQAGAGRRHFPCPQRRWWRPSCPRRGSDTRIPGRAASLLPGEEIWLCALRLGAWWIRGLIAEVFPLNPSWFVQSKGTSRLRRKYGTLASGSVCPHIQKAISVNVSSVPSRY